MACQTCGADYSPPALIPLLPADAVLHVCVICGAVIAEKGVRFHDDWHHAISQAAIRAERRLDELVRDKGWTVIDCPDGHPGQTCAEFEMRSKFGDRPPV